MKKILQALVILVLYAGHLQAQQPERKSIFAELPKVQYGIVDVNFNSFHYKNTPMNGVSFDILGVYKKHFAVGVSFDLNQTKQVVFAELIPAVTPRFSYYNASETVEYLLFPDKIINFSFPLKMGVGYAAYNDYYFPGGGYYHNYKTYKLIADDAFFVVEPGVKLMLNVFKNVSFNVGASYKLVTGVNTIGSNSDFEKLSLTGGLRIIMTDESKSK